MKMSFITAGSGVIDDIIKNKDITVTGSLLKYNPPKVKNNSRFQ